MLEIHKWHCGGELDKQWQRALLSQDMTLQKSLYDFKLNIARIMPPDVMEVLPDHD